MKLPGAIYTWASGANAVQALVGLLAATACGGSAFWQAARHAAASASAISRPSPEKDKLMLFAN